jgi:hypothetical protein
MTPYEHAALQVAWATFYTYLAAAVVAFLAFCAASYAGYLLYNQLKIARWTALLALEQDMASRRRHLTDTARALNEPNPPANMGLIYRAEKENYLNSVDRLASSILNGNFPEQEMKQDYRDLIAQTVREFTDEFQAGTHYRKTLTLYNKWQD